MDLTTVFVRPPSLACLLIPTQQHFVRLENLKLRPVPGGFCNLTEYEVSDQIAAIISYGPQFLLPEQATIIDYLDDFGRMQQYLQHKYGHLDPSKVFVELYHKHKDELGVLLAKQSLSLVEMALRDACNEVSTFFKTYPNVCIVQSDKGKKTCIMSKEDYDTRMKTYISKCIAKGVYMVAVLNAKPLAIRAFDKLRREILEAYKGNLPTVLLQQLTRFRSAHATLPHLYGTVKCHKEGTPMRPICSTVHWVSRPAQKVLLHILKQLFSPYLCTQNVTRIDDVATDVCCLPMRCGYVLVKMDVTDMYGSMDKNKIMEVIRKFLINPELGSRFPINAKLIESLLHFSLDTSCILTYGGMIYKQIRGLPQGACDSGYIATLYLDTLLQLHKESLFVAHHVYKWWKYMDDILLYMPERYVGSFKSTFEHILNLGLEVENEEPITKGPLYNHGVRRVISFLDLSVGRLEDGRIVTSRYIKPTSSMRIIHALSTTVHRYKVTTIRNFFLKILRRTSTVLLEHDLNTFYIQALHNGYPPTMVEHLAHETIRNELIRLEAGGGVLGLVPSLLVVRRIELKRLLNRYQTGNKEIIQSLRGQHVASMRDSRCIFPFRSVSLSHLIQLGCHYGGMKLPIYSRRDQSGTFSRFYANRTVSRMMHNTEAGVSNTNYVVGLVTCLTCHMYFVIYGHCKLDKVLSSELNRPSSALSQHQLIYGHVISPVPRVLRPIRGVDASYLNFIYEAIFSAVGVSCSSPPVLSRVICLRIIYLVHI